MKAADEEEAIEDVKVFAARFGDQEPEVLQDAADRILVTAKVLYGILSMAPAVVPLAVGQSSIVVDPICEDKVEEAPPRYIIVLSKRGAVLRLHIVLSKRRAQSVTFASFEFCDLDPVPRALYSHYCHVCWPRAAPAAEDPDEMDDDSTDSGTSLDNLSE